ncbi:unnamed protein product [Soboliphyme baturini]|uniref:Deoxyribonuclease II n=1 Tax=Soboliphyme baturini TaxID=241478 RepID=A0A183IYH5_9BILA|nr:unnamed protein product [Soboliphyme baturini]
MQKNLDQSSWKFLQWFSDEDRFRQPATSDEYALRLPFTLNQLMVAKTQRQAMRLVLCAVLLTAITAARGDSGTSFSCMNNDDESVPWFVVYVLPSDASSSMSLVKDGGAFLYMDSKSTDWVIPNVTLKDTNQSVYYTLDQYYSDKKNPNNMAIFYNNVPANGVACKCSGDQASGPGASKGVVLTSGSNTVWMMHSIEGFPDSSEYEPPPSDNANVIVCLSLAGKSALDDLDLYYSFVAPTMASQLSAYTNTLFTYSGTYALASQLQTSICYPPWPVGAFIALSSSSPLILSTSANNTDVNIHNSEDKSNWALAYSPGFWCFSDLPWTPDQLKMSGGAVCFTKTDFSSLVSGFESIAAAAPRSCAN